MVNEMVNASSPLLHFGSDQHLRRSFFHEVSFAHPAKLHLGLLAWLLEHYTKPGETIGDPMAGSGSILYAALLQRHVIARELEPYWCNVLEVNANIILQRAGLFAGSIDIDQADARTIWNFKADHLLFSPPYGCAMAATPSARRTLPYKQSQEPIVYGERWQRFAAKPTPGTQGSVTFHYGSYPGQMGHWRGKRYWEAMTSIYTHAYQALRPGGLCILILKDHIYKGKRIRTADETVSMCNALHLTLLTRHQRLVSPLSLWQRRRQERGESVVLEEDVLVFQKTE